MHENVKVNATKTTTQGIKTLKGVTPNHFTPAYDLVVCLFVASGEYAYHRFNTRQPGEKSVH